MLYFCYLFVLFAAQKILINKVMGKISEVVKPGVVTGSDLQFIFKVAKEAGFAIPAVNVVGSSTVNAVMEAAVVLTHL